MDVLFIGGFFPKTLMQTVNRDCRGKIVFSNHNFEMSLIGGFLKQDDVNLRILTVPHIASFPFKNHRFRTRKEEYELQGRPVHGVGFCNLWPFFPFFALCHLVPALLREFKAFGDNDIEIILNAPSLNVQTGVAIASALSGKHTRKTLIVPDVPQVMSTMTRKNIFRRMLSCASDRRQVSLSRSYDNFVFLTDAMKDYYRKDAHYIVMEGVVDEDRADKGGDILDIEEPPVILYSGSVNRVFGVMNLVDAFETGHFGNVRLWICGSGDAKAELELRIANDQNIRYLGLLNPEEIPPLLRRATVLVNPRTSEGEFTRYSFPSKTIEYLLSGRPAVINALPGIPKEYYQYVFTPEDESIEALSACLKKVLDMSEPDRAEFGRRGRRFVLENKNSSVQTRRILDLMKDV